MRARKLRKGLLIALGVIVMLPVVVLALALLALQFPPVRAAARDQLLGLVAESIQGKLEVDDLRWPSLRHVELSGVRLKDRHDALVANIGVLSARIDFAPLLHAKVHLSEVMADGLFVDLGTPGTDHGLLSVFESKEPKPPEPEKKKSSLEVQIDRVCLEGSELTALLKPDLGVSFVRFDTCAMFRMAENIDLRLDKLTGEVRYNQNPTVAFIDETALREHDAQQRTAAGAEAQPIAKALLNGTLNIADAGMGFNGQLELRAVSKRTLEAANVQADWLTGEADASIGVRGGASHMTYMLELRAPASRVKAEGEFEPDVAATLRLSSDGLELAKFTTITTDRATFVFHVAADLARKEGPKISANLEAGTYGSWPLPKVKADAELGKNGAVTVPRFEARYPAGHVLGRARIGEGGAIDATVDAQLSDLAKIPPLKAMLPGWNGQFTADANLTRAAEGGPITLRSHATLTKLLAQSPALSAERVDLRLSANGQPARPAVNASLSAGEVHFQDQRFAELHLTAAGGPEEYRLQGQMDGDRASLEAWLKMPDGELQAGGELKARLSRGEAKASVERVELVSGKSLEIRKLRLQHLSGTVVADGSLGLAGKKSQISIEAQTDNLSAITHELGGADVPGKLRLVANVSGALDKPVVDLKIDFRDGPRLAGAASELQLQAKLDAAQSKATINAHGSAGKAVVDAKLESHWKKGAPLSAAPDGQHELALNVDRVAIGELLRRSDAPSPIPIAGTIKAQLNVSGNLKQIELKSEVNAKVTVGQEPELGVKLTTEYGGGGLALDAEVDDHSGNLLEANWHQETRLEGFVDTPPKLPDLLGDTAWEAKVELASRRISELPTVPTQKTARDMWPLRAGASIQLSHKAGVEPIGDVKVRASWDPIGVDPARAACTQRVKPAIELDGKLRDGLFVSELRGVSGDKKMLIANSQLGSKLEEWLEGHPLEITKAKITAKLDQFDLAQWPVACETASGSLNASFEATDLFDKQAKFRAKLNGSQLIVGTSLPFDFETQAQALPSGMDLMTRIDRIGGFATIKASVPVSVYVHDPATSVDKNGPVSADVNFTRVDAKSLLALVPAVARPSGTLDGHIKVFGTLSKPRGNGSIGMKDVSLTLPRLGQRFTKVNGSIAIADNKVQIPELEVKDQGGSAKFKAQLELATTDEFKVDLDAKFDSFPVRKQGVLIGRANAGAKVRVDSKVAQTDVEVRLRNVSVTLTGDTGADVQPLDKHPEIEVAGEASPVEEEEEQPDPAAQARILNIYVRSDEPLWIRRDDFAVRMRPDITVHIAHGTPQITGEVKLERGYIALLGQQFDIKEGRVIFTGGDTVNPALELTAESTSPSGKVVRVDVTGFVSAPQLAFSVDDQPVNAGQAILALTGRGDSGSSQSPEDQLASAAIGMTTGLLSLGARREFGDWIPMLSIDQGTADTRVRAGFEVDKLIPKFMRGFVKGAYVEGVVSTGDSGDSRQENSGGNAQTGVLIELMLPKDLVWAGKYGPGQTWSVDLDWRP